MNIYDEYEKLYPRYDGIKQHPISESIAYISAYWVDVYLVGTRKADGGTTTVSISTVSQ